MKFKDILKTLLVRNVYYIPKLGVNILSVSSIPKLLITIDTTKKSIILSTKGDFLTEGIEVRGLYYLRSTVLIQKKKTQNKILNTI